MKRFLKRGISYIRAHTPEWIMRQYHRCWSLFATLRYGAPAREVRIIGITGTKGKTSTGYFLHAALSAGGEMVGLISTAVIKTGDQERINRMHMTMPGHAVIQSLIHQMKNAGCTTVIVEVTSEGIKYYRHIGVYFDILIFTNLTPEHLASHHNDFNEYKNTKLSIFKALHAQPQKGHKKHILANADDPHGIDFLRCAADIHTTFGIHGGEERASRIRVEDGKTHFDYAGECITVPLGVFNVYNTLPALILAQRDGTTLRNISSALRSIRNVPGRMEYIITEPVTVIVDYAHEPNSIKHAIQAACAKGDSGRTIAVVGGVGGGRDMESRLGIGREAGKHADIVVVTDVDPYDESPEHIAENVSREVLRTGKISGETLFVNIDRRGAIRDALNMAHPGDTVLITGKGSELTYMKKGGAVPWDERAIVREEVEKIFNPHCYRTG